MASRLSCNCSAAFPRMCCPTRSPNAVPIAICRSSTRDCRTRRWSLDGLCVSAQSKPSRQGYTPSPGTSPQNPSSVVAKLEGRVSTRRSGGKDQPCVLSRLRTAESGAALASGLAAASAVRMQNNGKHEKGHESHDGKHTMSNPHRTSIETQTHSLSTSLSEVHHQDDDQIAEQRQQVWHSSSVSAPASLSQALIRRTASATASASVGAAQQLQRSRLSRGAGGGLVMVAALTLAGVLTVVKSARQGHHHTHEECDDCEGCGICECDLCGGSGNILWEGKLLRNDPCPACLGDGHLRCGSCGGSKFWK